MFSFLLALINWNPRRWAGGSMHRVAFIEILYNIIGHQTAERAEKKEYKKGCRLCVLCYYCYLGLIWPSSLLPLITLWRIRESVAESTWDPAFYILKYSFSEKATKTWKNLPLVLTLQSKNSCFVKTGGRFFQILWPSHNVSTLIGKYPYFIIRFYCKVKIW